jgi:predicted nuclease with TOPRIM domain
MSHVEPDGAYETLLREHQELEADKERLQERVEELEGIATKLAERLDTTEQWASQLGARGAELCWSCEGTGEQHSPSCGVLKRQEANQEALATWEKLKPVS